MQLKYVSYTELTRESIYSDLIRLFTDLEPNTAIGPSIVDPIFFETLLIADLL